MSMSENASIAFNKLKKIGAPVFDFGKQDGYRPNTEFVLATMNGDGDQCFADLSGEWIKESWVNGEYINPLGLRQDVHEIFTEHHLDYEWENNGQLVVFELQNDFDQKQSKDQVSLDKNLPSTPPMSPAAHSAMKELARIGAPVWDFHSYSRAYSPSRFRPCIQFVMTCEPKLFILFADPLDAVIPVFSETKGLRPDVHLIVTKYGLDYHNYLYEHDNPIFNPKALITFSDPRALCTERGELETY